ncbi:DNA-binding LacI/PurR family transcriptional regulator [Microbacterium foliorum]|uniref:DNA-binding LacI/PurR family transcriptional regulator n=1 Tax=Microbacterium foliorum TaxID=104336 RepID=A0ABU1HWJ8_9MICO|nr:DNA-binding LacI/PurR family transcriptional regulator [Microbacterium foliorum]
MIVGASALEFSAVTADNHDAARLLADALVRAGKRRFVILAAPIAEITSKDRLDGFLQGLAEHGISVPESDIVHRPFSVTADMQT